ncbi:hypothetical protein N7U66_18995 [Lacinutrix neustonica]|uniref:Uncharacterized protein n=1 Tax=Lacinutrix neustonica TaxID=2980107 RepID=A0A9E8SDB3_9FLAO|nr:hypothetical protein [Lacinutrix neustonica]WAC01911.1 hypothetical protein N7U66_18995 [Lacinutrix neustonica]
MIRNILATFLGFIAASIIVYVFETLIGHNLFPLPSDASPTDMDWIKSNMNKIPLGAKAFVVIGHFMGIIVGMFIAGLISKTSMLPAYIVASILILATAFVTFTLPKGLWFILAEGVAVFAGFSFGKTLAQKNVYN